MKLVAVLPGAWMNNSSNRPFCGSSRCWGSSAHYCGDGDLSWSPGLGIFDGVIDEFGVIFTEGITLFPFVMPSS